MTIICGDCNIATKFKMPFLIWRSNDIYVVIQNFSIHNYFVLLSCYNFLRIYLIYSKSKVNIFRFRIDVLGMAQ